MPIVRMSLEEMIEKLGPLLTEKDIDDLYKLRKHKLTEEVLQYVHNISKQSFR